MAIDTQVVFPQETIKISAVSSVPGTNPAQIFVRGEDFSAVDTVEINEIEAPGFYVATHQTMYVTLPENITPALVRTVTVTSRRLTISARSILRFRVSKVPAKTTGILRLVQLFVKVLFTRPGSDIFSPSVGGNGLANLGRTFSSKQNNSITGDFIVSVQTTARQIISIQSRKPSLPLSEKLLEARVVQSAYSQQESALMVTVEITSQAGNSALVNVVV